MTETRDQLTAAEERRDYERCALLSLELSDKIQDVDMTHAIAISQTWVSQAQVYATLSLTRQLQLRVLGS